MDVKKKHEIEAALAKEAQAISSGKLKEDNPLDTSENFRLFCEACRRGDLKVCQEMIQAGVNINARDRHDYTALILVRMILSEPGSVPRHSTCSNHCFPRLASADTTKSFNYFLRTALFANETLSKASDAFITRSTIAYGTCSCPTTTPNPRILYSPSLPTLPHFSLARRPGLPTSPLQPMIKASICTSSCLPHGRPILRRSCPLRPTRRHGNCHTIYLQPL